MITIMLASVIFAGVGVYYFRLAAERDAEARRYAEAALATLAKSIRVIRGVQEATALIEYGACDEANELIKEMLAERHVS